MEKEIFPTTTKVFTLLPTSNDKKKNIIHETNRQVKQLSLLVQEDSYKSLEKFSRYNEEIPLRLEEFFRNRRRIGSPTINRNSKHSFNLLLLKANDSNSKFNSLSSFSSLSTKHFYPKKKNKFPTNINSLSNLEVLSIYKDYLSNKDVYSPREIRSEVTAKSQSKERSENKTTINKSKKEAKPKEKTFVFSRKEYVPYDLDDNFLRLDGIDEYRKFYRKLEKTKKNNNLFQRINNIYNYKKDIRSDKLDCVLEKIAKEEKTGKKILKRNKLGYYDIFTEKKEVKNPFYFRRSRTMMDINNKYKKETGSKEKEHKNIIINNILDKCKINLTKSEKKLSIQIKKKERSMKKTDKIFEKQIYGKELLFINTIKKEIKREIKKQKRREKY